MARNIFFSGVVLFLFILAAYVYSLSAGFFFTIWWWDIPMHILGGALAGLIGMWFFVMSGRSASYAAALCGAVLLGILVEIVEYMLGFTYSPFMSYQVDVIKDLFVDAVGGAGVAYLVSRL